MLGLHFNYRGYIADKTILSIIHRAHLSKTLLRHNSS